MTFTSIRTASFYSRPVVRDQVGLIFTDKWMLITTSPQASYLRPPEPGMAGSCPN